MLLNGLENQADPLKNLLQDGKSVAERICTRYNFEKVLKLCLKLRSLIKYTIYLVVSAELHLERKAAHHCLV